MGHLLDRPIKVLHILEATEGGTRRWLEDIVLGLDLSRIESACICSLRRDPTFEASVETFRDRGVKTWIVDMRREVRPFSDLRAVWKIARILRNNDFDILHMHSAKAGMLGRLAAKVVGVRPVLYTPHAFSFLADNPFSPLFHLLEKWARSVTDMLVAVSDSEAKYAAGLGYDRDRIVTVRNSVDARLAPAPAGQAPPDRPCIGTVGALRPQKDPLTFVEAAGRLRSRGRPLRFCLVGDGPLRSRVQRRIAILGLDSVFDLPGRLDTVKPSMQEWSVFVLCSRYEGLPYALLDAMAMGKPVVATRVPGIEEVVVDGKTGILVEPGNPGELARAIKHLLDSPGLAAELGGAAFHRVSEGYCLKTQLDRLTDLYETIVKETHASAASRSPL